LSATVEAGNRDRPSGRAPIVRRPRERGSVSRLDLLGVSGEGDPAPANSNMASRFPGSAMPSAIK